MEHDDWIWDELAIAGTADTGEIRRAYARRLKAIDPEADPNAFIELRHARDAALALAAMRVAEAEETGADADPAFPSEHDGSPGDLVEPWPAGFEHMPEPPVFRRAAPEADEAGDAETAEDADSEALEEPPVFRRPAAAPDPAAAAVEDQPPALDSALLERIDALLSAEAAPAHPGELEAATRSLLADPAVERIEISRWLETWVADRIIRAMPRSDPMIDTAIAHFRWDSAAADLSRPPVVDWILQRRSDRQFEADLAGTQAGYDRLLAELSRPDAPRPSRFVAWWRGPRVEYLLAYLHTHRPTSLSAIDPGTLAWWEKRIEAQHDMSVIADLREWRRKRVWEHGIFGETRPVGVPLVIGILLFPYVAAWLLLRTGYSRTARVVGFGWLALFLLFSVLGPSAPPPAYQVRGPPGTFPAEPPPGPRYVAAIEDLDPVLQFLSGTRIDMRQLDVANPELEQLLRVRWGEAALARESAGPFRKRIALVLEQVFLQSVREGNASEQLTYWQTLGEALHWARPISAKLCGELVDPATRYQVVLPPGLKARLWDLKARVLLNGGGRTPGWRGYGDWRVREEVLTAAARRAGQPRDIFLEALDRRGTPQQSCNALIALIDTILDRPDSELDGLLLQQSNGLYVGKRR